MFCGKERLKAQQYTNFLGGHESMFSYVFNVPGMVNFPLFLKYPSNRAFLGEGIAIRNLPSTYEFERFLVYAILCQITGKRSP